MSNVRHYILVFILLFLFIGGFFLYYSWTDYSFRYILFTQESVHGLVVDAPVEYNGVIIGKVDHINLVKPGLVKIIISIKTLFPLTKGTEATIISRGLASSGFSGYVYVALRETGTDEEPALASAGEPFPIIKTGPYQANTVDLGVVDVRTDLNDLTHILKSALDEKTVTSFQKTIFNLEQLTNMLVENKKHLNSIIIKTEQVESNINSMMNFGTRTFAIIESQMLPEAYQLLNNLNTLADTANQAIDNLNQDPSIVLRGRSAFKTGPGEKR